MKEQAYEQLTLFPADSLVSRFPLPGSDEARKMTVTSGRRCAELLKNSSPVGSLARMCLESSIWHSTRCYLSWKTSATPHKRLLFRLAVRTLRTEETGSLFWPTPKAQGLGGCSGARKTLQAMADKGLITEEERRAMSAGNSSRTNPQLFEWLMGYEQKFTELIPTPTATDYFGGIKARCWMPQREREREREREGRGYDGLLRTLVEVTPLGRIGLTNPTYVEWLMGYPTGWTELDASETP